MRIMEYSKIVAVSGLPGLYELLTSKTDGAIVRSLDDKTTRFVSSRIHNFSHLESIEVFTKKDNVNLSEILKAMDAGTEKMPDEKDPEGLKKYFQTVYPDMDFDRVYGSDLKKMLKWYSILKNHQVDFTVAPAPPEESPVPPVHAPAPPPAREIVKKESPKPEKTIKKKKEEEKEEPRKEKPAAKKAAAKEKPKKKENKTAEKKSAKSGDKKKKTK
jgi:hypothetical protein